MEESFEQAIRRAFTEHDYTVDCMKERFLFVYDSDADKRSYMTMDEEKGDVSLSLSNPSEKVVTHICIDGGIVEQGKADYVGDGKDRGRPDCMVFTDKLLMIVELKMNLTSDENKRVLANCFEGLHQIEDFYCDYFTLRVTDIDHYYPHGSKVAIVCPKYMPSLDKKRNSQRIRERELLSEKMDMKIEFTTQYTI